MATNNVSFGNLVDPEQQAIERRRALAQALQQESMAPIGQQEAGGRAVAISPVQGIAKLVQALAGKYGQQKADDQQQEYVTRKRGENATELQGIIQALKGTPATPATEATPEVQGNNPSAYVPAQAAQPGTPQGAPDPDKALMMAMRSQNPQAQAIGSTLMSSMLPKTPKWTATEQPQPDGTVVKGFVDVNSRDPIKTFQPLGTAPVKNEFVNGQGVNPFTAAPTGQAIPKQPDAPNLAGDLLVPGANGQLVPNSALIDAKKQIAKSGASNTNISVTADKSYASNLGEGLAKQDVATLDAARNAPQQIATSQRILKLLDTTKPITGTGADARLAVNKAFATAGLVDPKDANATEALISDLNKQTLSAVKSSGLGAGNGFTDKDLQFLQSATSGSIASTPANIRRMAQLNDRAARETIKKGQGIMTFIKKNPDKFGSVGNSVDLQMPPEYASPSASGGANDIRSQADKILSGGQ